MNLELLQPSPKHRQMGERGIKGTPMDLSDKDAQIALDSGIAYGRQIYSYYKGKYYEFQSDNAETGSSLNCVESV